ncbi:MAG: TM2 domain-containing protein [Oscillatoria sp. PMC 1051.18]|nr:TM2 domain-containing protein [Oscillatoria sp. PMC 1050.18]MEC5031011.1 TM2 domain-containing protein [Oscillatoria sp. PMC 1051.18]
MNDIGTSYLFWLGWFFGLGGLHRLYNKKLASGFLWMCTWGLFGVGQFIDFVLIPNMVNEHNLKIRNRLGLAPNGVPLYNQAVSASLYSPTNQYQPPVKSPIQQDIPKEQLMIELAKAAQVRGGKISVTQAVIDTEVSFEQVEAALNEMVTKGYVGIENHPLNGVVIYNFLEL